MKLRNKKTGEIVELDHFSMHYSYHYDFGEGAKGDQPCSTWNHSLAELNEEWEDAPEEPKEYWIPMSDEPYPFVGNDWEKEGLATGLISLSKKENEIKREKLKAWKRLKDKGLRFHDWKEGTTYSLEYEWKGVSLHEIEDDLDLLFGGEE